MSHRWISRCAAATLVAALGCAGAGRPPSGPAPAGAAAPPSAALAPATKVTLRGVAQDAKGGAVVVTDRGPIYVLGLDAWPAGLVGRAVEVTGVVRRQKLIPDPVGPDGTIAQGAWGDQLVIVEATWRAVE